MGGLVPSATLSGIGRQLRDARHARDLSIEEAAWRTRIRPEFLRALEQERFSAIGHHAFVRSHLHSYARVLGLDPDEMVSMYRDAYGPEDPSPIETLNRQVRVTRLKRPKLNWVRAAAIAGAILVAAGVVGVLHGPGDRGRSAPGLAALPRLSGPSEASRDRVAKAPPAAGVRIEIAALGRCWVRITVDGARAFEGVLTAGDRRSFDGATVEVVLGNAAAARILVNGDPFDPGVAGVWRGTFGPEAPKT
jgi:cytoskeleton protein RodZ